MRFAKLLCLGFVAAAALGCPAHAQDADQSLRILRRPCHQSPEGVLDRLRHLFGKRGCSYRSSRRWFLISPQSS